MGIMIISVMIIAQAIIASVEPTSEASSALVSVGVEVAVWDTVVPEPKATLMNANEMPTRANKIMRVGEESFFIIG